MLLLEGVRKGSASEPVAQNTTLGWILSGPAAPDPNDASTVVSVHQTSVLESLDTNLRRFWEVEEIPQSLHMTPAEQHCENHFLSSHSRASDGHYILRLPFKSGPPISLGESRSAALSTVWSNASRVILFTRLNIQIFCLNTSNLVTWLKFSIRSPLPTRRHSITYRTTLCSATVVQRHVCALSLTHRLEPPTVNHSMTTYTSVHHYRLISPPSFCDVASISLCLYRGHCKNVPPNPH